WKVPLRDDVQVATSVSAPRAGYIVPAEHAATVARQLRLHAIAFEILDTTRSARDVEVFRASTATFAAQPFEGRMTVDLQGSWRNEKHDIAAGSLYVPIAQSSARIIVALLEPQAPDSLAAWGVFNNAFETKEYMEDYVAESVARSMLKNDPALAATFNAKLADDKAFAADPRARLAFFARRHSSWDEQLDRYPVFRVAVAP
ncbi:MAG: peptidase M14, partial [Dokdonella sp.]